MQRTWVQSLVGEGVHVQGWGLQALSLSTTAAETHDTGAHAPQLLKAQSPGAHAPQLLKAPSPGAHAPQLLKARSPGAHAPQLLKARSPRAHAPQLKRSPLTATKSLHAEMKTLHATTNTRGSQTDIFLIKEKAWKKCIKKLTVVTSGL